MKSTLIVFLGVITVLVSGCSTAPKENYQQVYEQSLADGSVTMVTLRSLDSGDIRKTKQIGMTSLYVTLEILADAAGHAHPTPEQKQEEIALAREVLGYTLLHRGDIDPRLPSVRIGVHALQKILTAPDDVQRLTELSDYLAGVEKKMSDTTKP
jgi:hypothetical protein